MDHAPLKLYGYWRSSCSWRVRWALKLKRVAYDYVPVNLLQNEHRSPEHLKRNPSGGIPVLEVEGGFHLTQSLPILEWLDEVYADQGPRLFPGTSWQRAHVRSLCETLNADTGPLVMPRVQKALSADPELRKAWAQKWIREGLRNYDELRSRDPGSLSFQGDVSAADLCLIPQLYNAQRFEIDVAGEFPELFRIGEACRATSACQEASPEAQIDAVKES